LNILLEGQDKQFVEAARGSGEKDTQIKVLQDKVKVLEDVSNELAEARTMLNQQKEQLNALLDGQSKQLPLLSP